MSRAFYHKAFAANLPDEPKMEELKQRVRALEERKEGLKKEVAFQKEEEIGRAHV